MTTTPSADLPADVIVVKVTSHEMLERAYAVRLEVFVQEQNVPIEEELDQLDTDPTTTHVLALDAQNPDGPALGTARLLPTPNVSHHFHIGRVAVRASARGRNVGAALMSALENRAAQECAPNEAHVELSAQIQASGFYKKLGYEQVSDRQYLDAGILHVDMGKTVSLSR